jgi:hypothetical protein
MSKHRWGESESWGVSSGSGRPHGVDETWTCKVCGAQKSRGPANGPSGQRVIVWSYMDAYGDMCEALPECIGHNPWESE